MRVPRLLVSVVDAGEAAAAAAAGASVIDAKDPSRGALGAVSALMLARILAACPPGVETSAALGDLGEDGSSAPGVGLLTAGSRIQAAPEARRLNYVKIGLRGCHSPPEARRALARFIYEARVLGAAIAPRLIIATYADHGRAPAPAPHEVPELARGTGAGGCLLDTAVKDGSCLLDWIDEPALASFVCACREQGLLCALAGSLRVEHLPRVARLGPDLIGVRGAACDGHRVSGRISRARVEELAARLSASAGSA